MKMASSSLPEGATGTGESGVTKTEDFFVLGAGGCWRCRAVPYSFTPGDALSLDKADREQGGCEAFGSQSGSCFIF